MTVDVSDYTVACTMTPGCRHAICKGCGEPVRPLSAPVADHPGTKQLKGRGMCHHCDGHGGYLTDEDTKDHSHVWLQSDELERIRDVEPHAYAYHMARRPHRQKLAEKKQEES